jgi:ankyrin repeat protein
LTNNDGTALCIAIETIHVHGDIKIIDLLIEYGADVNLYSPLTVACTIKNIEIINLLVKRGANLNLLNENETVLMYTIFTLNNLKIAKILFELGADPYIKNSDGKCALEIALENDERSEMFDFLLDITFKNNMREDTYKLVSKTLNQKNYLGPVCVLCLTNPSTYCSQKCHHLLYCDKCFNNVKKNKSCPLCRSTVSEYFKIYY